MGMKELGNAVTKSYFNTRDNIYAMPYRQFDIIKTLLQN